jgi:hypothetical protein
MAEAFSESLAYPQVKKRAVASRSFRTKITPSMVQLSPVEIPFTLTFQAILRGNTTTLTKCILNSK